MAGLYIRSEDDWHRLERAVMVAEQEVPRLRNQLAMLVGLIQSVGPSTAVTVRLTGDKDAEGLYPGVFTYPDPNPRPGASESDPLRKWYDGSDATDETVSAKCRVRPANEGDTLEFLNTDDPNDPQIVRYEGRMCGQRDVKSVDPDGTSDDDGFPVVIAFKGGSGTGKFFARCTGGTRATGYTWAKLVMTGPNVFADADPAVTGTAYRTPSDFEDDSVPIPPEITSGETIEVEKVSFPPMTFGVEYVVEDPEGDPGTVTFTFTPGGGTGPYTIDVSDFGEGTAVADTGTTVTFTYPGPGPYTVTITLTDSGTPPRVETKTFVIPSVPTDADPVTPAVALGPSTSTYWCTPWGSMQSCEVQTDTICADGEVVAIKQTLWARDLYLVPLPDPTTVDTTVRRGDTSLITADRG